MFGYEEIQGIPYGIVILSRLPMLHKYQVKLDADRSGYLKVSVFFNSKRVTLFVAHPPSPRSKTTIGAIEILYFWHCIAQRKKS